MKKKDAELRRLREELARADLARAEYEYQLTNEAGWSKEGSRIVCEMVRYRIEVKDTFVTLKDRGTGGTTTSAFPVAERLCEFNASHPVLAIAFAKALRSALYDLAGK